MLFKKSLEEFYRHNLFQSVEKFSDEQEYLALDSEKYIAMSLLQKAIRRGEFSFAFSSALTLLNLNDRAFWRRMCIIVFEDIGIANLDLVGRITIAAGDKRLRQKLGGDRLVATALISEMCNSEKDRSTDDLLEYVERADVLEQVRDDLAEMNLNERLSGAINCTGLFSHQSTAAMAAAVGLPSDPQKSIDRIASSPGEGPKYRRDKSLMLVGFAGGLRRSEIVSLNIGDLEFVREGLILTLRKSKTDQEAVGRRIGIPFARGRWCPVLELMAWLDLIGTNCGPVFRSVRKSGAVQGQNLSGEAVSILIKKRVSAIDLNPSNYSGHYRR